MRVLRRVARDALMLLTAAALAACRSGASAATPVAPPTNTPASSLSFTYLGVAGWTIDDGRHIIVIDPYLSRVPDSAHAVSDPAAVAAHGPTRANLVAVGHAHYDHSVDAAAIALRTGAVVLAAPSVLATARDVGVADDHLLIAQPGDDYELDGFSVRVIASLHSATGVAAGGDVATVAYLLRLDGAQVLVFDTANFDERALDGVHPDVAIVATGLRHRIHDYTCRLMRVLGAPRVVLPTHFDDFRAPPGTALDADAHADLDAFARELHTCAPATRLVVPTAFTPVHVRS
jgi:L-ascorbate metabolism protein UlaG (beta-lactamase superfamily)